MKRHPVHAWSVGALGRFLEDAVLPLDNDASEGALRTVALGRKNFLFVGHDEAGANIAGLYSLVATCQANGVDPEAYLADVLLRVQSTPSGQIDDLLPHRCSCPVHVQQPDRQIDDLLPHRWSATPS